MVTLLFCLYRHTPELCPLSNKLTGFKKFQSKKIKFLPAVLIALFFLGQANQSNAQIKDTTVFPLNDYLYTLPGNPYPVLNKAKLTPSAIHKPKFVNVMDFGAKGDGVTPDDDAIASAFRAAKFGVIFPSGKTFLVTRLNVITLTHDLSVYAYGATIKMKNLTHYSFLSLEYQYGSYHNKVIWLGGTFDGNKDNQSWPGSPTGNNTWVEDHGRFIGVCYAQFALFKDVNLKNTVMDGIGLEENRIAVIADSKASGGVPFVWSDDGDQGTYFKCTRPNSHAFYCMNLTCDGGSIGVHYSTPNNTASDSSVTVITNCHFYNQSQDAIHFEDCKKVFLYNSSVGRDINNNYSGRVHISNATNIVSVKKCQFKNARLNFNNASNLKLGVIDSSDFTADALQAPYGASQFIEGRPNVCINSTFTGKTADKFQTELKYVRKCTFTNFDSFAVSGANAIDSCTFKNGMHPATLNKNGFIINCNYENIQNETYKALPPADNSWANVYLSYINISDDKKNYLGKITCGGNGSTKQNDDSQGDESNSVAKTLNSNNAVHTISIYPNPTADLLNVNLNEKISGKTALNIYNEKGLLLKTKIIDKNSSTQSESMDVKNLATGAYVLQIVNGNERSSYKFLVASR